MVARKIKTKSSNGRDVIYGVLNGKHSYLGSREGFLLSGHKLYRLAKAIVKHYESQDKVVEG